MEKSFNVAEGLLNHLECRKGTTFGLSIKDRKEITDEVFNLLIKDNVREFCEDGVFIA